MSSAAEHGADPAEIGERLAELRARLATRSRQFALQARALARSERRFRDVIERNADAIVVVDQEGTIRFANHMAARLFGRPRDELTGTPFGFPVVAGETTELELFGGGEVRVAEMRVVESEWEESPALIASLRDITDRKRAEENARRLVKELTARVAAEDMAARFRFLAECAVALSSSLDYRRTLAELARHCATHLADWVLVYAVDDNQKLERLEVAHRDPASADLAERIRRLPTPLSNELIESVLLSRKPVVRSGIEAGDLRQLGLSDEQYELVVAMGVSGFMLVPLVARDHALGVIALIASDPGHEFTPAEVTLATDVAVRAALSVDNARLYQDAQQANRTKTEFLALVSHDLRTPLNSIIGYTDLMMLGIPEAISDGTRERLGRVRTSAQHLLYLMDELLAFSRLETHHEEVKLSTFDLVALLREVVTLFEPITAERNLELTLDPPDSLELESDPNKLRQILMNLVGNAVKFTAAGQVTVQGASSRDRVILQIADTGPGIPPEQLAHIFEPFWQADRSQRTRGGGTGLGLSIVQRLVRMLGGEITVDSAVGLGSRFTVTLPVRPTPEMPT